MSLYVRVLCDSSGMAGAHLAAEGHGRTKVYEGARPTHFFGRQKTLPDDSLASDRDVFVDARALRKREGGPLGAGGTTRPSREEGACCGEGRGRNYLGADGVTKLSPFKRAKS